MAEPPKSRKKKPGHHECPLCNRVFTRGEHLARHASTHTRERPYRCYLCTCAFARSDLLNRHVRTIHADVEGEQQDEDGEQDETAPRRKRRRPNLSLLRASNESSSSSQVSFATPAHHQSARTAPALAPPGTTDRDVAGVSLSPSSSRNGAGDSGSYSASLGLLGLLYGAEGDSSSAVAGTHSSLIASEMLFDTNSRDAQEAPDDMTRWLPSSSREAQGHNQAGTTLQQPAQSAPFGDLPVSGETFGAPAMHPDAVFSGDDWLCDSLMISSLINAHPPIDFDALLLGGDAIGDAFQLPVTMLPTLAPSQDISSRPTTSRQVSDEAHPGGDEPEGQINPPGLLASNYPSPLGTPDTFPTALPAFKSYTVSSEAHKRVCARLTAAFADAAVPPLTRLPSRHGCSRYFKGFMDGFVRHFPFLHKATFQLAAAGPVLVLAILALGAKYVFEDKVAKDIYQAALALTKTQSDGLFKNDIEELQARLLLMAMGTWTGRLEEALGIQSRLAMLARLCGLVDGDGLPDDGAASLDGRWQRWIEAETARRTKFTCFCFFNLQSTTFNVPPALFTSEIQLTSVSHETAWRAASATEWQRAEGSRTQPSFQSQLADLSEGRGGDDDNALRNVPKPSEFASYALISAILQSIFLRRQSISSSKAKELLISECTKPLQRWRSLCESEQHPLIHAPLSPLSFNGSALLRLSYIRLLVDFGTVRAALTGNDPSRVATAVAALPAITRSSEALRAAHHAASALRIPTKLGIELAARTQTFVWSLQHSLCSFECALLLSKWISAVEAAEDTLSSGERSLLSLVDATVAEASDETGPLAARTLNVWAKLYEGTSTWSIVPLMGRALRLVAAQIVAEQSL